MVSHLAAAPAPWSALTIIQRSPSHRRCAQYRVPPPQRAGWIRAAFRTSRPIDGGSGAEWGNSDDPDCSRHLMATCRPPRPPSGRFSQPRGVELNVKVTRPRKKTLTTIPHTRIGPSRGLPKRSDAGSKKQTEYLRNGAHASTLTVSCTNPPLPITRQLRPYSQRYVLKGGIAFPHHQPLRRPHEPIDQPVLEAHSMDYCRKNLPALAVRPTIWPASVLDVPCATDPFLTEDIQKPPSLGPRHSSKPGKISLSGAWECATPAQHKPIVCRFRGVPDREPKGCRQRSPHPVPEISNLLESRCQSPPATDSPPMPDSGLTTNNTAPVDSKKPPHCRLRLHKMQNRQIPPHAVRHEFHSSRR